MKKRIPLIVLAVILAALLVVSIVLAVQGFDFTNTVWSLLPPVAAILLAQFSPFGKACFKKNRKN